MSTKPKNIDDDFEADYEDGDDFDEFTSRARFALETRNVYFD